MVLGVALGLLHANAVEWLTHKYVLHGLGKRKGSVWRFHWAQHHRIARKNAMYDRTYEEPFWSWKARGKEIAGIMGLAVLHLPLVKVAPYFTASVLFSSFNYLYRHRKAHVDVEWGKKHMPHHYDHHMGENQDANWCVSYPWFDWILGTRERSKSSPAPVKPVPSPSLRATPTLAPSSLRQPLRSFLSIFTSPPPVSAVVAPAVVAPAVVAPAVVAPAVVAPAVVLAPVALS